MDRRAQQRNINKTCVRFEKEGGGERSRALRPEQKLKQIKTDTKVVCSTAQYLRLEHVFQLIYILAGRKEETITTDMFVSSVTAAMKL